VLIKADVQGSAEALRDSLMKLSTDEVAVKVVASGVGGITESDIMLAAASRARLIAFNVRADAAARAAMKDQGVDVRYYSVIYEAIDDVRQAMTGMLSPEVKEQIVGLAQVREGTGTELPLVTSGDSLLELTSIAQGRRSYTAQDVLDYLLADPEAPSTRCNASTPALSASTPVN